MSRWRGRLARIRRRARQGGIDLACGVGLGRGLFKQGPGARILVFHGVVPLKPLPLNTRFISVARLERYLRAILHRFEVVSLAELLEGRRAADRMTVALTFDDGYLNNVTHALPVLERLCAPATFFVTTVHAEGHDMLWADYVDVASHLSNRPIHVGGESFVKRRGQYLNAEGQSLKQVCAGRDWSYKRLVYDAFPEAQGRAEWPELGDYWRPMLPEQLRQLAASPLATVGLHGQVHEHLGIVPLKEASERLSASKAQLEAWLDAPVTSLAYPDGSYTRPLLAEAEKLGFSAQLAVAYLHDDDRDDPRVHDRLTINPFVSADVQSRAIIDGHYG